MLCSPTTGRVNALELGDEVWWDSACATTEIGFDSVAVASPDACAVAVVEVDIDRVTFVVAGPEGTCTA